MNDYNLKSYKNIHINNFRLRLFKIFLKFTHTFSLKIVLIENYKKTIT